MRKLVLLIGLGLAVSGVALAQDRNWPLGDEMLEPEILAVLAGSGVVDRAALRAEDPVDGAASLPNPQELRSEFEAAFGADGDTQGNDATLEALECGEAECSAVLTLGEMEPEAFVARLAAVEAWLSDASPCGYSLSVPQLGNSELEVQTRINCAE